MFPYCNALYNTFNLKGYVKVHHNSQQKITGLIIKNEWNGGPISYVKNRRLYCQLSQNRPLVVRKILMIQKYGLKVYLKIP